MREHELETATMPAGERARQYSRGERQPIPGLVAREIRMIKAGAYRCAECRHRTATVPDGSPAHLRPLCEGCAVNAKLDRQVERQRSQRAAMRAR